MLWSFVHGQRDPGTDFWETGAGVVVVWILSGKSLVAVLWTRAGMVNHRPYNVKDGTRPL